MINTQGDEFAKYSDLTVIQCIPVSEHSSLPHKFTMCAIKWKEKMGKVKKT